MEKYSVFDCTMIELDKHHSNRKGNLTVVQNGETLPFDVKRVYYLYDVPGGEERGSHAHRDFKSVDYCRIRFLYSYAGRWQMQALVLLEPTISRSLCKAWHVERLS